MTKLKLFVFTVASMLVSVPAFAGASSANPTLPTTTSADVIELPTEAWSSDDVVQDADDAQLTDDDGDADAWQPPDPGPQYSDDSIASAFREEAARVENVADDVAVARADVEQARADGEYDATLMQASGVGKIVESGADAVVNVAGELGGPEHEVAELYGQAKAAAGAAVNLADGNDAEGAIEMGKAIGETLGADSALNRAVNASAAVYDAAHGEYGKATGEAITAAGDAATGGLVSASAGVATGMERYEEGAEARVRIDEQAHAADERMAEQEAALRDRADDLRATAADVEANLDVGTYDEPPADDDSGSYDE